MSERRKSTSSRRTSGNRKVNRAQKRAMEVRSAESAAVELPAPTIIRAPDAPAARISSRTRRRSSQVVAPKAALLTRVQEYAYIRSDMRRLLITASSLLAVMLVLLVIIE